MPAPEAFFLIVTFDDIPGCGRELLGCSLHERFEVGLNEVSPESEVRVKSMTDFKSREH